MARPRVFARRVRRRADQVERGARDAVREAVNALATDLIQRTPVGGPPTSPRDPHPGLARSNWQVFPGFVSASVVRPHVGESEAIAEALASAQVVSEETGATISNPVPYIHRLNAGSSTQAPPNFVDAAINRARTAVSRVRIFRIGR